MMTSPPDVANSGRPSQAFQTLHKALAET